MPEEALNTLKESGFTPEQLGSAVLYAAEEYPAEEVGENLIKVLQNLDNDDEFEVFESVLRAITSKGFGELLEDIEENTD